MREQIREIVAELQMAERQRDREAHDRDGRYPNEPAVFRPSGSGFETEPGADAKVRSGRDAAHQREVALFLSLGRREVGKALAPRMEAAFERFEPRNEQCGKDEVPQDTRRGVTASHVGELVVRHEFAHVRRGDAAAGVLWHLVFAALLIPGFEALERRFHARRERLANLTAAEGKEQSYLSLMSRIAPGADLCVGARLGLEAAARRPEDRWLVWVAPVAVVCLAIALPLSHLEFRHDLPYLLSHHC